MVNDKIEREVSIGAPAERVWHILTSAEGLKQWYAFGGAEIDLRPGGKLVFRWDEHGKYLGVVETVDANQHFSFRFAPFTEDAVPAEGNSTLVDIELTPDSENTTVRLVESGYSSLDLPEDERAENYQTSQGAWEDSLNLLKSVAEKQA